MKEFFTNLYENIFKEKGLSESEVKSACNYFTTLCLEIPECLKNVDFTIDEILVLAEKLPNANESIYLRSYINYLLKTNRYDQIVFFFSKVFNQHIGNVQYSSRNVKQYDITQRAFDKFVEASIWTKLQFRAWVDMLFEIIGSSPNNYIHKWKVPATDFLVDFSFRNEKEFYQFTFSDFSKYGMKIFDVLLNCNVYSATSKLVDFYLKNDFPEKRQVKNVLKQHYNVVRDYVTELRKEKSVSNTQLVEIMLLFKQEKDVQEILKEIYLREKDKNIKKIIIENVKLDLQAQPVTIVQLKKNSSRIKAEELEFLGKKVSQFPALQFYTNEVCDDKIKAYFLNMYRELCSPLAGFELDYFHRLFQPKSLNNFCEFMCDLILNSKSEDKEWAICLAMQNISPLCAVKVFQQILKTKNSAQNIKPFVKQYIFNHKNEVINLFNDLECNKPEEKCVLDVLLNGAIESNLYDYSQIENMRDKMIPYLNLTEDGKLKLDDGFSIEIEEGWGSTIVGDLTNVPKSVLIEQKKLDREIARQTKRLQTAFSVGRMWMQADWERYILNNPLMKLMAKTLLWGKYIDGNLTSVFKVTDADIVNLVSVGGDRAGNMIGIFHPVELSEADLTFFNGTKAPFNQIYREVYSLNNYNKHASVITRFNGFIVLGGKFFERMENNGWKFSMPTFSGNYVSMQKVCRELGLLSEINFSPVSIKHAFDGNLTLGELRFYRLSAVLLTGNNIVTNKANSLEIIALKDRYFSDIIFEISSSGKK